MSAVPLSMSRRAIAWLIDRNPTYLVSACLVAVGARGLLVDPASPAGDVTIIVVTLAALQLYEWAVGAILIALHRARRSPEDTPSLLLVGALFWTGPVAATLEMIALRPDVGTALTAGACVIAIGEMLAVCRALEIRLRRGTYFVVSASIALLAVAAPLLKMPVTASGINEILLYAAWWCFGALILACRGIAASYCNIKLAFPSVAVQSPSAGELGFLGVTLGATAVHLCAMNYGYFCHARLFYAAPAIVAVAAVGFSLIHPFMARFMTWITLLSALPLVAVVLATGTFDPRVPVELLPEPLRNPLVPTLLIASAVWFYAFARHRFVTLFHAGSAALAAAVFRAADEIPVVVQLPQRAAFLCAVGCVVAYLLIVAIVRRSRGEALVGLAVTYATFVYVIRGQTAADRFIVLVASGWMALAAAHIAARRPRVFYRLAPVALLALAPWLSGMTADRLVLVAGHSGILIIVLIVIGSLAQWTGYRAMGMVILMIYAVGASTQWIVATPSPTATILTIAGFLLLAGGAVVSWNKEHMLQSIAHERPVDAPFAPLVGPTDSEDVS
ncbi:MAG: hypothetical protein H6819_04650 [Phycisphaerales bacterium]|nr:hypothetical protein [Phycisphaerales bacterium]MCB9856490.1 hypothetical protein [Phycisphaerales bacterium]MCB9863971.1 hypothetical protein [Phycisphaerales bacterium]